MNRERLEVTPAELVGTLDELLDGGLDLATVVAHDDGDSLRVVYVLLAGPPERRVEVTVRLADRHATLASLSGRSLLAGRFEREIHDVFGIDFTSAHAARPLVNHGLWPAGWYPMRRGAGGLRLRDEGHDPYVFGGVQGAGIYEIPVGPVHAGLIEPGHFRFSVVGETILRMSIRLGYLHRGLERLAEGRTVDDALELAARVSGDSTVAHSLAFTLAIEEARGVEVSGEVTRARLVLLELERLHNHLADLGAMCNDVGFAVANARAQVARERLLRLFAEMTGHRLGRGAIGPGRATLARYPAAEELADITTRLEDVVDLALSHSVVVDRFAATGVLRREDAAAIGATGPSARASGLATDARQAHPMIDASEYTPLTHTEGDVRARFDQRVAESRESLDVIARLAGGADASPRHRRSSDGSGLGVVEGWRGRTVHRVELDGETVTRLRVTDPSFANWPALSLSLHETIVPDFPLVNKSFNFSYAGNDL